MLGPCLDQGSWFEESAGYKERWWRTEGKKFQTKCRELPFQKGSSLLKIKQDRDIPQTSLRIETSHMEQQRGSRQQAVSRVHYLSPLLQVNTQLHRGTRL